MTRLTSADLATLLDRSRKSYVGLEEQFDRMWRIHSDAQSTMTNNYPPYNLYQDGDYYHVEIAVAGFKRSDLDIEVKENMLVVTGKTPEPTEDDSSPRTLHRGIAARQFTRSFILGDDIVVEDAKLEDGMLTITMVNIVPEAKKPRKIEISGKKVEFLVE